MNVNTTSAECVRMRAIPSRNPRYHITDYVRYCIAIFNEDIFFKTLAGPSAGGARDARDDDWSAKPFPHCSAHGGNKRQRPPSPKPKPERRHNSILSLFPLSTTTTNLNVRIVELLQERGQEELDTSGLTSPIREIKLPAATPDRPFQLVPILCCPPSPHTSRRDGQLNQV